MQNSLLELTEKKSIGTAQNSSFANSCPLDVILKNVLKNRISQRL